MAKKKEARYGWRGINGVYYVYDRIDKNIPLGYGYIGFKSRKAIAPLLKKLNKVK